MDEFKFALKRLAAEHIELALMDMSPQNKDKPKRKYDAKNKKYIKRKEKVMQRMCRQKEALRNDAIRWVDENSRELFGFAWCVAMCGINPNYLRRLINRIKAGEHFRDIRRKEIIRGHKRVA